VSDDSSDDGRPGARNLVEAVDQIVTGGGTGIIQLAIVDGRLSAIQVRSLRALSCHTVKPQHDIDDPNFVDAVIEILKRTGYGTIEEEIQRGKFHQASYKVTGRRRRPEPNTRAS
jgi:hypothetical protein